MFQQIIKADILLVFFLASSELEKKKNHATRKISTRIICLTIEWDVCI